MHVGRYGRDAELGLLAPIFLGAGTLVRGYTAESIANRECLRVPAADRCDAFGRLLGSRMLVGSAEYRLPLTRRGGGALGIELAPFVDAGLAWSAGQSLAVQPQPLSAPVEAIRRPVVSAGTSLRISAGSVILEIFHARPLQRGGSVFGLNVAPGW
jgi:outer membrane protein assembly factor BamA